MARPLRAGGKASAARSRKASSAKGRTRAKTKRSTRSKRSTATNIELKEARDQQAAAAEILKVIASSPDDVQPVFNAIAASANRLIGGYSTAVHRVIDDMVDLVAFTPTTPAADEALMAAFPQPRSEMPIINLVQNGETVQFADAEKVNEHTRRLARARGWRSLTVTPLMNRSAFIGYIVCTRREAGLLADHHVQLLRTFAAQAVIAIENARLFNEVQAKTRDLEETLQQQTATADVLKVISRSAFDLQSVLQTLVESAARLCGADKAQILRPRDSRHFYAAASYGHTKEYNDYLSTLAFSPGREGVVGRVLMEGQPVQIADVLADSDYRLLETQRLGGFRTHLGVPLLREGNPVGILIVSRITVRPFDEKQIELVTTFADQAVIAIENARLFNETQEALERQTATAEVLEVISSSPGDLDPVFRTMLEKATRICGANFGLLNLIEGDGFRNVASHNVPVAYVGTHKDGRFHPHPNSGVGRVKRTRQTVQIDDLRTELPYLEGDPHVVAVADVAGARTVVLVPMLKEDELIGVISIYRQEVRPFGGKQIELLTSFASQAVIAIENARLLKELRARTDDLSESLDQQTATSEVLQVISSSTGDVVPVFHKLLENATRVCGAEFGSMNLFEEGAFRRVALYNAPAVFAQTPVGPDDPIPHPESGRGIVLRTREVVQIADLKAGRAYLEGHPATVRLADLAGARTILVVPMLRNEDLIGTITIYRQEVQPFGEKQIELLKNFASQAVIAIENARILGELRQRTDDLSEALAYQTGSANILNVIASSPTEVGPVLKAIVKSACELCGANDAILALKDGDDLLSQEHHGSIPVVWTRRPINRQWTPGRAVVDRRPVHVHDLSAEGKEFPEGQEIAFRDHVRTVLSIPLLRENESIGAILLRRTEIEPFSDKQIALLQTFADQAVIAIGNVRLFDEVQARTTELTESLQQQTATSEVLQVISSSQGNLEPVFQMMLEKATHVCGANFGTMNLWDGESFNIAARHNVPAAFAAWRQRTPIRPHPESGLAIVIRTHQVAHFHDLRCGPAYLAGDPANVAMVEIAGARTIVTVPMLKENTLIGTLSMFRQEVRPFTAKQIALVENFTKQAVIAIENARLLNELRQRTNDLSKSLDDLRTAQDRLVQTEKLASLGQLTAGIAHEIKNPLNFVNNFSQLSAELVDEMTDVFQNPALDEASRRKELDEIRELLKGNLEKVVQHGRRADSIVKNMLLHSREGSGELRAADINALVEESLNLAYHGARAEKSGFTITLQREFDANAGSVELFPQEITRALLNLISNGFYAATKRKVENSELEFEPTLLATTRSLGTSVEIRIRDNGTGIPPEVKEKIFNPFFTTKPAGEGTGLGLSMTHDIVVKQHGGSIGVETEPGAFTEFIVTLPRATGVQKNQRSTG